MNRTLIHFSFHVGNPEGIHQLLVLFSDRGTPKSVRYMNAYSGHTYKFTKAVSYEFYMLSFVSLKLRLGWLVQIRQNPRQNAARGAKFQQRGGY